MKNISKIKIQNFQNHADTEIDLTPGINLIIGSSDAGKSAVLRAINLVFHNLPRSTSFVRHGTDTAIVSITFDDGTCVTRIKGSKRNAVQLTKSDGQELAFEKIGNELPIEIIEALGNPPIDERHGPISYSKQMDPLFLTSLTSTELPRSISELTGIDDFEEAASLLGKKSNAAKKDAKDSQERVSGYEADLEKYTNLDKQLEELEKFKIIMEDINNKQKTVVDIDNMLSQYGIILNTGKITNRKLKLAEAIAVYKDDLIKTNKIKNSINDIEQLINKYKLNEEKENKLTDLISQCSRIMTIDIENIEKCAEIISTIKVIEKLITEHGEIMRKGYKLKEKYSEWNTVYNSNIEEKIKITAEMKEQGLWCDNCQRPLTKEICEHNLLRKN